MKTLLFCIFGSAGSGRAACRYRCGARCFLPENAPPQSFTANIIAQVKEKSSGEITAFCSKNTTEFSEISRWRWSECWGGDSPARHCRFVPATVKTVPANVGERHAAPGDALAVRTNRRQNGNSLRFVIARRPQADVAISGRQLRFRRKCPVIHPGSARLHPKGTSSRFAPRAPRRFAPRNDTSGWCRGAPAPLRGLMLLHKAVTDRHAGWPCCGIDSMARGSLNCHCEEPQADVAISGRQLRFRRKCPVIHPGSARLPRAQSALAMTSRETLPF